MQESEQPDLEPRGKKMNKICIDCGSEFHANAKWKVRCTPCWREIKGFSVDLELEEDIEKLELLMTFCNPDDHGNSSQAHEVYNHLLALLERAKRYANHNQ